MGRSFLGFPDSLSEYSIKDYLRIVMIICTYLIIRPYLVKVGENIQRKQYEKEGAKKSEEGEEEEPDFDKIAAESSTDSKEWSWGSGAKDRAAKQRKLAAEEIRRKEKIAQSLEEDDDVSDLLD
ncbi:processing of GAS1 and ALP protein 2 [Trichomonascus vanleenenianus]|uniref:Pga2p n=1 Tax=Trichomonascus vanleenenianus TaxID=2268995 RepID=UPI003ECA1D15